jgi:hypothetical protein
VTSKDTNEQG